MYRGRGFLPVLAGLALTTLLAVAGTAQAHAGDHAGAASAAPFGCRASVARLELGDSPIEPAVANDQTYPRATDSAGVSTVSLPQPSAPSTTVGPAGAFTYATGSVGGATAPGAASVASIQGVTIPTSSGTITIVGPAQANASYACENNQTVASGQSTLNVVYVNGTPQKPPAPGQPATIPLGGGAYLSINEQIKTPTSLTERVLDVHLADGSEIVVGEAKVTQSGADVCAGTGGVPPVLEICPPGSTLDVPAQECVLYINGGQTIIYVSKPFQGPSGGTVVALPVARQHHHSPCLTGPGPKYALIATKPGARVLGTLFSDRILALGAHERVAGLGGNDCIDGRGANQHLYDGNGDDRVWASGGFNRIAVGQGNDHVHGRNGRDWITAGNGNDIVYGGNRGARIDLGSGHDHVHGGHGKNRIWALGDYVWVNCGPGKFNTALVRPRAARYAARHGCRWIWELT